ncbi:helix-turn-helix domain-containing protein [Mucilaginibacter phenanthrenivorans]|uniref:helix-turn-helix domain-containing protein n=1 Tax=Mucilaginibacter phenanthrenivorans TaxID=1234842 RepID=UPI0021582A4C|nr:helix-turn-helix domain-containing protein [Mucilaginibacter phenanthrenivorans]
MEILTFDQLPKAVSELLEKVSKIENILSQENNIEQDIESPISIQQASAFLNLSISTLYGKVCRREIPVSKQGKRLYFSRSELIEWIKAGRKRTTAEVRSELALVSGRHK